MLPDSDDQHVALAILELEVCSGQRWQDIPDANLHDAIASLTAIKSEEQLRHAIRYIKRWRDHAVHGQPLPPSEVLLSAVDNRAARTSLQRRLASQQSADKPAGPATPGIRFGQVVRLFMTARAFRRYVYPAITEMQAEYHEALDAGDRREARWVVFRGHFLFVPGFLYGLVSQSIRRLFAR